MKRLDNPVMSTRRAVESGCIFTPTEIVDFLSHVAELSKYEVTLRETTDNSCQIAIGNSLYCISDIS